MFNSATLEKGPMFIELVVVCVISVLGSLAYHEINRFPDCATRSPVSRVQADLRSLATCIESYYVDQEAYPVHASGLQGANASHGKDASFKISTFRNKLNADDPLYTLTTPISYCTSYFSDPFAGEKKVVFGYYSSRQEKPDGRDGWLMWSAGPDEDYDIDPIIDYTLEENHPSASLINKTYDPTNGTKSNGDVWRAKQ